MKFYDLNPKIISCSCSVYFPTPANTAFIQLDIDFFFSPPISVL